MWYKGVLKKNVQGKVNSDYYLILNNVENEEAQKILTCLYTREYEQVLKKTAKKKTNQRSKI